jgi:hypothetical protein
MNTCFKIASAVLLGLSPIAACAQTAAPTPVDAERMTTARAIVGHVFPAGTYQRIMNGSMDAMMSSMMDGLGKIPLRDLAAMGGVSQAKLAQLGEGTLAEVASILDPAFQQRMDLTMHTTMREMGTMMSTFEPAMQDGLAEAYARRFTSSQLSELKSFFETPTGNIYAAESMMLFMDPAVMTKMQAWVPELMKQMPALMAKVKEATARLPAPRKPADLSSAERQRLAKLLGTTEQQLLRGK